jgi:GT2 family glycosyltransferase
MPTIIEDGIIEFNTDDIQPGESPKFENSAWENRAIGIEQYRTKDTPLVSVLIVGYNRFEKTKYCVECFLKYAGDLDCELYLFDNGSTDGKTLDFFKSVEHSRKTIVHVTKNLGSTYASKFLFNQLRGKYFICLSNDCYVTKNCIQNLIKCMEADPRNGGVVPMFSQVSNIQQDDLGGWKDFDEMQKKAVEKYGGESDPNKWEERMRLVTPFTAISKLLYDMVSLGDRAFIHDFGEDDWCAAARRIGFKLFLCKDAWACHDHNISAGEDKESIEKFRASLDSGRRIYKEKYWGIDAWDDINNYEFQLLAPIDEHKFKKAEVSALSIDVKCGTPVLMIRNAFRRKNSAGKKQYKVHSWAFTTQAKYYLDLQTTEAQVVCDRIDFIHEYYEQNQFDIICVGEPINQYKEPLKLLKSLYGFLKPNGLLLFKLRNTTDFQTFLNTTALGRIETGEQNVTVSKEIVHKTLTELGATELVLQVEAHRLSQIDINTIQDAVRKINPVAGQQEMLLLLAKNIIFKAVRGIRL